MTPPRRLIRMNRHVLTRCVTALLVLSGAVWAQGLNPLLPGGGADQQQAAGASSGGDKSVVTIEALWSQSAVEPGGQATLAVVMDIDVKWHVQLHEPELDWLVPTEMRIEGGPAGVVLGDVQWPKKHPIEVNFTGEPQTLNFYSGRAPVFYKVRVPADFEPGQYDFEVHTTWQACDDTSCLAPQTTVTAVTLTVAQAGSDIEQQHAELFAKYTGGAGEAEAVSLAIPFFGFDFEIDPTALGGLLLIAAIGGFLLNLTPCVLPLIPIKIMSLSAAAEQRSRCLMLGAVMSAGVVAFWLMLGLIISTVSWFSAANQLFQYPAFTIGVGLIIAVMAAGMMGLFTARLPQWVYTINVSHDTVHGSFAFGIMTAILSTPCTAPFMGAAAGWAATQNPAVTMSTFAAIGVGMAAPYMVLSAWPKLVDRVPRGGPAGELIKQVMGLLLLAAGAYFVGTGISGLTVTPPDPPSLAYWYFVALFIAAAGAWLAWRTIRMRPQAGKLVTFVLLGVLMIGAAGYVGYRFTRHGPITWTYFTEQRYEQARQSDKVVVLEFTAQWCLNCHALEQAVLFNDRVVEQLNSDDVAAIKVDITGKNPEGSKLLESFDRRTIPLLVVIDPEGNEVLRSDAYTVQQVLDAINKAKGTP